MGIGLSFLFKKRFVLWRDLKGFISGFQSFEVSAAASMRTVVVRFADVDAATAAAAAAYYIATADFIGVSRRTRRSDAASDAVSCVNETNKS
ncbi:unnamed protein product [Brassica napus]|uniref:(rape) hypothetical protein n=1 Tax=Brassica napus TaxID=3708 RepID=A0A816R7G8_BRANA|nr:unnamed protein product [Brassica napus]